MQVTLTPRRRQAALVKIAAAALALLTLAGLLGYLVRSEGAGGDAGPSAASTGGSDASAVSTAPESSRATGNAVADQAPGAPTVLPDDGVSGGNVTGSGVPGDVSRVIRTADLVVVVGRDGFADTFQRATEMAQRLGGFVTYSDAQQRSGTLTIRVPAVRFDAARAELKDLGVRTQSESIQGQDVTAEFVDLRARLEILQARKDALVKLLREASTLSTILRLQNEVDGVLTQIEQLKGQIRLINDQASLATITVTMREEGVTGPAPVDTPSLVQAWRTAVAGAVQVLAFVIVGLGYLLPIAAIGGVAWFATRSWRGRRPPVSSEA